MSAPAPFRFKLKVKTGGDGAGPTSSAQTGGEPLPQRGQDHYTATSSQPEAMQALLAFWVSAACTPLKLQHGMQTA
jgi:hypothetical protein